MALLTREILDGLGIHLSDEDYSTLSEHFESTLHARVIDEVAAELTSEKAHELANMQDASDDQLLDWLTANVNNFAEIVSDEVDVLLGEIADNSEALK